MLIGWWKFQGRKPRSEVFYEHPWKFHFLYRGHVYLDLFMDECNDVLFLPLPPFGERHENFYENFLPHLVSTTCKLTRFQMQLESVLNSLYQKQQSRDVLRKMCSENMHAANFIYRITHTPKCNLLNSHCDCDMFSYKSAAYFQNTFF